MTGYPLEFIRGISNPEFVTPDGQAKAATFQFKENMDRKDNFFEASINWRDDEVALQLILSQRKDLLNYQFKFGAAIVETGVADMRMKLPKYKNGFSYERFPLDNNKYHGNLLLDYSIVNKADRKELAAFLAHEAKLVPR